MRRLAQSAEWGDSSRLYCVSYAGRCPSVSNCFGPDGDVLMTDFNHDARSLIGLQGGENGIGNNGAFAVDVSAVSEPAAWLLSLAGLALLGLRGARRRH